MGWTDGAITTDERKMLGRVFVLNDRTVGDVMKPREKITTLSLADSLDRIMEKVIETGFTRFPVTDPEGEKIIGSLHAKDLFRLIREQRDDDLQSILRQPYLIPASRPINMQLRLFQSRKLHQAVVQDEAGRIAGLVTLENIVEQLVGSIEDEHDDEPDTPPDIPDSSLSHQKGEER
jgi:CBS domain containing-hemolysin-like protein